MTFLIFLNNFYSTFGCYFNFIFMILLIILFFFLLAFVLNRYHNPNSVSFVSSYLERINKYINIKACFVIFFTCFFIFSLAIKAYLPVLLFALILINLYLNKWYILYIIHLIVLIRLVLFFSPYYDVILDMTVCFESFSFFFCIFGYLFFLKYHYLLVLWMSTILRIMLLGSGVEEVGTVFAMYTLKIYTPHTTHTPHNTPTQTPTNTPPSTPPITPPASPRGRFFDTIETHQHAAITHNTNSLGKKPYLFGDKLLKPWERVYFDTKEVSAAEQAKFLKHGGCGRMLANFEVLAQTLGKSNVIKYHSDGYEKEMIRVANSKNLPEPDRTLVTVDWSLAQENEEFIAIKSYVEAHFPNELIKIARGYGPVDFILTRQDGSRLFVDVTSLSDENLIGKPRILEGKLTQLAAIEKMGSKTKVLLYNYRYNSPVFFNAPKLDNRIMIVSNTEVQQLLSSHDVNVDFQEPIENSLRLFSFGDSNTEAMVKYPTLPKENAIKTIQFTKK